MSLELRIPMTIPRACSPNGRYAWSVVAKAKAELRRQTYMTAQWGGAKQAPTFEYARITLQLHVYRKRGGSPGYRPKDGDNLMAACKGLFDGLKDAGVIKDDSAQYVEHGPPQFIEVARTEDECIAVVIEEVEAALKVGA